MRTIEEIKADYEKAKTLHSEEEHGRRLAYSDHVLAESVDFFERELRNAITLNIEVDRLEEICAAERDGRCAVQPCKVGDTVYVIYSQSRGVEPVTVDALVVEDEDGAKPCVYVMYEGYCVIDDWHLTEEAAKEALKGASNDDNT